MVIIIGGQERLGILPEPIRDHTLSVVRENPLWQDRFRLRETSLARLTRILHLFIMFIRGRGVQREYLARAIRDLQCIAT